MSSLPIIRTQPEESSPTVQVALRRFAPSSATPDDLIVVVGDDPLTATAYTLDGANKFWGQLGAALREATRRSEALEEAATLRAFTEEKRREAEEYARAAELQRIDLLAAALHTDVPEGSTGE